MIPLFSLSALLFTFTVVCLATETVTLRSRGERITALATVDKRDHRFSAPAAGSDGRIGVDDTSLLDIVLVASVDGKFHALNRTSGHTLWSMSSTSNAPSTLGPLVRTNHVDTDPDLTDDDTQNQELYVVEPQSGDIYVMATPNSPLQRLHFSMSQLVDMSPFSFSGSEDRRVFVGKKETSLLLVELETGKVKATINSECPWDPFENLAETDPAGLDLDELEGTSPPKSKPREVYIGRTDYHISIHTRPLSSSGPRPPVQNLSFSTYGPNNQDHALQNVYRRTADDAYVQSLANGEIYAFKTQGEAGTLRESQALWINKFSAPTVAVFDVLTSADRHQPFVLLQPRPRLEDVASTSNLPNVDAAYVGLVEQSGSLFAMTPNRFPLVAFGDRSIDPSPSADRDLPPDLDSVTKARKLRAMCRNGGTDRRCLTGLRSLHDDSQLLDGAPHVEFPPDQEAVPSSSAVLYDTNDTLRGNGSILPPWIIGLGHQSKAGAPSLTLGGGPVNFFWGITACLLGLTYALVWYVAKKTTRRKMQRLESGHAADAVISTAIEPQSVVAGVRLDDQALAITAPAAEKSDASAEAPAVSAPNELSGSAATDERGESVASDNHLPDVTPAPDAIANAEASRPPEPRDDSPDGEESDKDADTNATPAKRKGPRRRRGKGGKGKKPNGLEVGDVVEGDDDKADGIALPVQGEKDIDGLPPQSLILPPTPLLQPSQATSLIVSETVLGFGSHGTVVLQGSLQGRAVAVKRLLQDFVTLASREVSILQESDDHPNVIRYYYQEAHANFLYIALELCPASLADVIESPDQFRDISMVFEPKRALRQIASGLRHLHSLKIVHRDIKPQNILVSTSKAVQGRSAGHRMLISDFGLCKKLDVDQTSFLPTAHGALAAGTVGWRAPEILRGEVKLDDNVADDQSQSSRGSTGTVGTPTGKPTRLTKSVDIFALGCLFYYTLTNGSHPYGDRFEREVNILRDSKVLGGLERFGEEGSDAVDLIGAMLHPEAYSRPDTTTCLLHPFFWDPGRRLTFLQDASDRFEIMCRDPRDPDLITLEKGAVNIVGNDWHSRLDKVFIENLGKFRKYDGRSVQDLLRALRNKKHHYQDLPENVKRHLGPMPEGFLSYFTRRFPRLFLHVHGVIASTSLHQESMFRSYFELVE
ncbi:hypothetical protein PLICRDRAFT_38574 [Plicaturopsis crispa FD-325 SS-3]|nr:hypothetical protein PLICRDRAFT_38574 [Plicaturopsis crispa FD-325 SS-3]